MFQVFMLYACVGVCVCFTVLADVGQVSDDLVGFLLPVTGGRSCERHGCRTEQETKSGLYHHYHSHLL